MTTSADSPPTVEYLTALVRQLEADLPTPELPIVLREEDLQPFPAGREASAADLLSAVRLTRMPGGLLLVGELPAISAPPRSFEIPVWPWVDYERMFEAVALGARDANMRLQQSCAVAMASLASLVDGLTPLLPRRPARASRGMRRHVRRAKAAARRRA